MPILGVNVDHVATLRQARGGQEPDPVRAALVCQQAGAHSIVMHLREDRRHIQDADLFRAKDALKIRLNMEMSVAPSIVRVASRLRPAQATLVPEKRQERTTEGGLDVASGALKIRRAIDVLKKRGIDVSLFIDPDARQIESAIDLGADSVEFHTGDYANHFGTARGAKELQRLEKAAALSARLGLLAHAGHGLDYVNVKPLKKIKTLVEYNIGYSIVSRAVWIGLDDAVREMKRLLS
jgi:pyridoxine 5-phosphate synthase